MKYCSCCGDKKFRFEMELEDLCSKCYYELMRLYNTSEGRLTNRKRTKRKCLKCEKIFWSEGNHNRLCKFCNEDNRSIKLIGVVNPKFEKQYREN